MDDLIISQPMTFTVDVKTGLVERPQRESLMRGDRYANRIIVELVDGSQPFDITGVAVKGEFCKPPNGDSINLPGEAKGNVAEVQLTDQCYTAGGHYEARVILVLGEVERTVLFISGDVLRSGSGNEAGEEPGGEPGGGTGSGLPAGGTAGQVLVKVSSAQGDAIWKTLTAEDVGARPANWMPTAEDVNALPSDGTAANANALNGKSAEFYAARALISDVYDAGKTYNSGDYCISENVLYKCLQDNVTGIAPTNTTYWEAVTVGAEFAKSLKSVCYAHTEEVTAAANSSMQGSIHTVDEPGTYLIMTSVKAAHVHENWPYALYARADASGISLFRVAGTLTDETMIMASNAASAITVAKLLTGQSYWHNGWNYSNYEFTGSITIAAVKIAEY